MTLRSSLLSAIAAIVLVAGPCFAQQTDPAHGIEAIRGAGKLACGTIEPEEDWNGQDQHGDVSSLAGEICRAVATAILGDPNKVQPATFPAEPEALAALHSGRIELAMGVSPGAEAAMQWSVGFGPAFYFDSQRLLVMRRAGFRSVSDLKDRLICSMVSSPAERTLRDEMTRRGIVYALQSHSEQGEMDESVAVGRCNAGFALESRLADSRADFPAAAPEFVFLPERFGVLPVVPAWRYGDERFGLVVRYTIDALIEAEALGITRANVEAARQRTDMRAERLLGADRTVGQALGLAPDWAAKTIAAVGNYGEIFDRTLGKRYGLERGLNALWTAGGLMHPNPMQ